MITNMNEQNVPQNIFIKYRKWLIAAISIHLIPGILLLCTFLGVMIHVYVSDDILWHPYRPHIQAGYEAGLKDGNKDRGLLEKRYNYIDATPWEQYQNETPHIQKQAAKERDEYLAKFPENERGAKRAEMSVQNIKLPLELEAENRFTDGIDFYTDYVAKNVIRADYANDKEHLKAMQSEGWKLAYAYGYGTGWISDASEFSRKFW